jgi:beta-galactosidase beta subunit
MKYSAVLSILMLFAYGCNRNEVTTKLLSEQEILKDSANNISERISCNMQTDSADSKKKQLGAIHARLIDIQSSLDSLEKMK